MRCPLLPRLLPLRDSQLVISMVCKTVSLMRSLYTLTVHVSAWLVSEGQPSLYAGCSRQSTCPGGKLVQDAATAVRPGSTAVEHKAKNIGETSVDAFA